MGENNVCSDENNGNLLNISPGSQDDVNETKKQEGCNSNEGDDKLKLNNSNETNIEDDSDSDDIITNRSSKRNTRFESGSESDVPSSEQNVEVTLDDDNFLISSVRKNKIVVADIDESDEESVSEKRNSTLNEESVPLITTKVRKPKRIVIVESDSDAENEITPHNKSFSDDVPTAPIFTTNSKGELVQEQPILDSAQRSRLSALCDSESSDEESVGENIRANICDTIKTHYVEDDPVIPAPYKKSKQNFDQPKKMTAKRAAEQMKEIRSESQRMVRESNISLPYHKPKAHSLQEFLARRSKLSSVLPVGFSTSPSVAIKMSKGQLELISKKIKEREKEVQQFYKSESEEEDPEDEDYVPENKKQGDSMNKNNDDETGTRSSCSESQLTEQETKKSGEELAANIILKKPISQETSGEVPSETYFDDFKMKELNNKETKLSEIQIDDKNDLHEQYISSSEPIDSQSAILEGKKNINDDEVGANKAKVVILNNILVRPADKCPLETFKSTNDQLTLDYDFNLDDVENDSEKYCKDEHLKQVALDSEESSTSNNQQYKKQHSIYNLEELDSDCIKESEVRNGLDRSTEKRQSKLELLKEKLLRTMPRLSGGPNDVIDLESGIAKPNEVVKLIKRFQQHTAKKVAHKNKVNVSVISVSGGEIHKETVAMSVDEDENDPSKIEERPGVKLQRLRDELQSQMAQKRSELWQQKKNTADVHVEEKDLYDGEKSECGADDDYLDDEEEEAEMTDDSDLVEELDEDIEINKDKPKVRSAFVDDEAEVSDTEQEIEDDEPPEIIEIDACDEKGVECEEVNNVTEAVSLQDSDSSEKVDDNYPTIRRSLKRIIKGFTEDSDDDDIPVVDKHSRVTNLSKAKDQLDSTTSADEDDIFPPNQIKTNETPQRPASTLSKSDFGFLTPVTFITGLHNLNSATKSVKDSPLVSPFQMPVDQSPLKDNRHTTLQKKLFSDLPEPTESQNMEYLAEMCSGTFPSTAEIEHQKLVNSSDSPITQNFSEQLQTPDEQKNSELVSTEPSTQDLLGICSGQFTGETQLQDPTETPGMGINKNVLHLGANEEVKSLDEHQDFIISQLLDEDELERFKKKFDSPVVNSTQRELVLNEDVGEVIASGGVIDSDDEELEVKKKKRQKKLMFSDDESSDEDDEENEADEEIDLHDEHEDDELSDVVDKIGYDSEENEYEIDEAAAPLNMKLTDFFENEAELSESEWGSADEDEKDLDAMEEELGDTEKFDEDKVRNDLEKIHMRRMLDDDTKEIKLLQELLLEDGELHGSGRQKQFKWKNIDSTDDGTEENKNEDFEQYLDEEESEEQWRKRRHEREMFLKEKQKTSQDLDDDENLLNESQLLKIGHKVLVRSASTSQTNTPVEKSKEDVDSVKVRQSFSLLSKRGSFLSRSEDLLQRMAEYTKVAAVPTLGLGTSKNSRNFVFQSVSSLETTVIMDKKRKATEGTPNVLKKLRLSELSPAVGKKTSKSERAKKLFGNW